MGDIIVGILVLFLIIVTIWVIGEYLYRRFYRHPVYCEDCIFFSGGLCTHKNAEIIEDIEEDYIIRPTNTLPHKPKYISARAMRGFACGKYAAFYKKKVL